MLFFLVEKVVAWPGPGQLNEQSTLHRPCLTRHFVSLGMAWHCSAAKLRFDLSRPKQCKRLLGAVPITHMVVRSTIPSDIPYLHHSQSDNTKGIIGPDQDTTAYNSAQSFIYHAEDLVTSSDDLGVQVRNAKSMMIISAQFDLPQLVRAAPECGFHQFGWAKQSRAWQNQNILWLGHFLSRAHTASHKTRQPSAVHKLHLKSTFANRFLHKKSCDGW